MKSWLGLCAAIVAAVVVAGWRTWRLDPPSAAAARTPAAASPLPQPTPAQSSPAASAPSAPALDTGQAAWQRQLALGQQLLAAGQTSEAALVLQLAVHRRPDDPVALTSLAMVHVQRGDLRRAIGHYRQALRAEPNLPLVANDLAWLLVTAEDPALRDPAQAVALAQAACRAADHHRPEFLSTLALAAAVDGRWPQAEAALRRAIEVVQTHPRPRPQHDVWLNAYRRRLQQGARLTADTALAELVGRFPAAWLADEDWPLLAEALAAVLDSPHAPALYQPALADQLRTLAGAEPSPPQAGESSADLTVHRLPAAGMVPLDGLRRRAEILYLTGEQLLKAGRTALARQALWLAVADDPDHHAARRALADRLLGDGQPAVAAGHYRQLLEAQPAQAELWRQLGAALVAAGALDEAIDAYRRAFRSLPQPQVANDLAFLLAAGPQADTAVLDEALQLARWACRQQPSAEFYDTLAIVQAAAGRFHSAVAAAEQALRLLRQQDDPAAPGSMADGFRRRLWLYLHQRPFRDPRLGVARELAQPPHPGAEADWLVECGRACVARGRLAEGLALYEEALRIDPGRLDAANDAAYLLAAAGPSSPWHDPQRAVALAEQACAATGRRQPEYLDTLAAAHAAAGNPAAAVAAMQQAVALLETQLAASHATSAAAPTDADEVVRHRLARYHQRLSNYSQLLDSR